MGKRGPRPLPSAMKRMRGTYQKCRAPAQEMTAPAGVPPCPAYLDPLARAFWDEVVPQLAELGVLSRVDGKTLEGLCCNYSQAVKFQKLADKKPMMKTPWGPKPNPAAREARKCWALVKQFAAEFGLSPSARTRVGTPKSKDSADETGDFLFGKGLTVIRGGARG